MDQPKVSVCITAYNQEKFIAQAIESALAQETRFPFEILIGEDDSSDRTRDIVQEYAHSHPEKIRVFLHSASDKLFINGRPTGRRNFINNILQARGKYIALLDGDDYWIDNSKLEKQVALLDARPDCAVCFHDAWIINDDGENTRRYHGVDEPTVYQLEDIVKDNFIPTASAMARAGLIKQFPDFFYKTLMADWPFHILNAQHGAIAYLPEIMAVYRMHDAGRWTEIRAQRAREIESRLQFWDLLEPALDIRCKPVIAGERIKQLKKLVKVHVRSGDYRHAKEALNSLTSLRVQAIETGNPVTGFILKYSLQLAWAQLFSRDPDR